ncbi:MAG: PAS domain-containing protein [Spirochaetes bacterium]|jgi:two-component system CheB/CheR fusion protein|nr:PAS domain-containing protein [Spirochaetota bacterium]
MADKDTTGKQFHIVGVGASAGGLEAIEAFFEGLPEHSNLAIVIVQHLSPDYKSLMGELLRKRTEMPIHEAEDGMTVEPGRVYLIPRKKTMTMFGGKLFLSEQQEGLNLPIDIFFESLAEDQGERSIAVVLSGTGSDGTRGIRAVKEAGGVVMVQDEETAKFNGMPNSAVATGIVDFVLPPGRIAAELLSYAEGSVALMGETGSPDLGAPDHLSKIFLLIKRRAGVDLSYYKESTIVRRVERRMGINRIDDLNQYLTFMEENPQEVTILFKEILIGVTKFFRDPEAFEVLAEEVLPEIFENSGSNGAIRVWVPGCSTGEEAYSLAILLAEFAEEHGYRNEVKVFATDIDKDAIEFASYGTYPESIAADMSSQRLSRFFVKKGDSFQVVKTIREMVIFAYHNVFKDPPFRRIDLVTCRNLLIYLQPVLQKRVVGNFQFSLNQGGFLFLGTSESLGDLSTAFHSVDVRWKIFRHKDGLQRKRLELPSSSDRPRQGRTPREHTGETVHRQPQRLDVAFERLVEAMLSPCVIIDESWRVLHIFGSVSDFFHVPTGRMEFSLNKMLRPDLSLPISTAVQDAMSKNNETTYENLRVEREDEVFDATVTVKPIMDAGATVVYAILLRREEPESDEHKQVTHLNLNESVRRRMSSLEGELQHTKENLQATIEELETSNEELQATNEELLSSNEELQSTNEELQSVNEELITVNAEYQKKIEELSELNDDMNNLLTSTDIGTVFLDKDLIIRKYTPPVTKQINLIAGDVGRPFSDISNNLLYDSLTEDVESVLREGAGKDTEVRSRLDRWYLVKILPYHTESQRLEGVVVTLIDITERKAAEQSAERQHDLTMRILESNPTAITMVDRSGHIVYANRRGEEILGLTRSRLESMVYNDPNFRITDCAGKEIPAEELPFGRILVDGKPIVEYVHRIDTGDTAPRTLSINGSPIYDDEGRVGGAVFNFREIDCGDV